jgi:hypothetical protein
VCWRWHFTWVLGSSYFSLSFSLLSSSSNLNSTVFVSSYHQKLCSSVRGSDRRGGEARMVLLISFCGLWHDHTSETEVALQHLAGLLLVVIARNTWESKLGQSLLSVSYPAADLDKAPSATGIKCQKTSGHCRKVWAQFESRFPADLDKVPSATGMKCQKTSGHCGKVWVQVESRFPGFATSQLLFMLLTLTGPSWQRLNVRSSSFVCFLYSLLHPF